MKALLTVTRKELRGAFQSPVALLFFAVFVLVTLFSFFTASRFFARNIADVRPLFEWLPLLLIFLVSAVTMRMWAEERKMGTLELMLTLPLRTRDLVLGKFFAATALVGLGLALTFPLPIMVSLLGDIDWGPVIGGYLGALLLGSAYAAIGLAVSARTDNQVVALMLTLAVGGALYLVGTDSVVALFGNAPSELLRNIGTGSRFESIARGVIDLRDLVYYGSIVVIALALNMATLERARIDAGSTEGGRSLRRLTAFTALVVVNAVLANVWLAPVARARVDVTENGDYSISQVTRDTLAALPEPLFIEGYFSERTHPLLAPLVPQIRDILAEYEIAGRGRVSVEFADPNADPELEERVQSEYGVRSVPFRVQDRTQQAVVNSYFHLVVRYGDTYETLSFDDLIEVQFNGDDIDVRLRNLEYDMTRAIRKVSRDFTPLAALLENLPGGVTMNYYVTPNTLPESLVEVADQLRSVANELAEQYPQFRVVEADPSTDPALQQRLRDEYAIDAMAADLFATQTFYLDVVMQSGNRAERIVPRGELDDSDIRRTLEASIRRLTPGQRTTVGLYTQPARNEVDPSIPPQFQPPPRQPDYQAIRQLLAQDFEIEEIDLMNGIIPGHIDTLLIAKPGDNVMPEQVFAIDQFLMRGGTLIVLAGQTNVAPGREGFETTATDAQFLNMLSAWGVTVGGGLVMDEQNAIFPVPVRERRGGMVFERIEMMPYALFPDIRADGFDRGHPALRGLPSVTFPWGSPLVVAERDDLDVVPLLQTSETSWVRSSTTLDPDFETWPESGFGRGDETAGRQVVAVALTGTFPSYFADRPSPIMEGDAQAEGADATGQTIRSSLPGARIAVIGSSEFAGDIIYSLSNQPGGEVHRGNVQLVQNLLDWAVEDTELLQIRTSGAFARTLRPVDDSERGRWELGQVALSFVLLIGIAVVPAWRRRQVVSFAREVRS